MFDVFLGTAVPAIGGFLPDLGLERQTIIVAMICAGLGTIILSRYTFQLGILTYPVNFCVLAGCAVMANMLLSEVRLPIGLSFERPVIISLGGMVVGSLLVLLLLPRDSQGG